MSAVIPLSTMVVAVDGTLAAGTDDKRFTAPCDGRIVAIYGSVITAASGADILVDIHKGGTTIFTTQSNRVTIAAEANDGSAAAVEVADFVAGDVFTVDTDQVGSATAGADLVLTIAYEGKTN